MIYIKKSPTADTRTCDFSNVSKSQLCVSSYCHIDDVAQALTFILEKMSEAAKAHDFDKIMDLDHFHADFLTGFEQTGWWDKHRKVNRHHIDYADGVRKDVNLVDVLEHIVDCVMAGMARSGKVTPIKVSSEVLQLAVANTAKLLQQNTVVTD